MAGAITPHAARTMNGCNSGPLPLSVDRKRSAKPVEGNTDAALLRNPGSESRGMIIPPSKRSNKYRPFWAAKLISARSRPARMSPTPANDAVPRNTAAMAKGHALPAGFHPRSRPIGKRTAAWKSSTTNTERIFAMTNCERDNGVVFFG